MSKRIIVILVLAINVLFGVFAYTPVKDTKSTYEPTQIKNGSFDQYPWMDFEYGGKKYTEWDYKNLTPTDVVVSGIVFHGVGEGWNTTEIEPWQGNLFEFVDNQTRWYMHNQNTGSVSLKTKKFIEMNCKNPAILYQDLKTVGGDVIRWTLEHAVEDAKNRDDVQSLRVEIGAPQRDDSGNILNATGIGNNLNYNDNTKLIPDTVAIFRYTSVTDAYGNASTIGFGNLDELSYLKLYWYNQGDSWYVSKGVYIVPEGQTVSRFAFISEAKTPNYGNLLDNITFSTLIGNLSATQNLDRSITIKGYWGDSDANQKLYIKFNTDSQPTAIDMSGVLNQNFKITIPKDDIPENATTIEVYHQNYESAKRTLEIVSRYNILMYVGEENANPSDAGFSLAPTILALKNFYEGITSTNTGKVKMSALYTTDSDYLIKVTDLISDYSLIFVCFPDSFGTNTQTVADNLINYTKQGGCLVMIGETVGTGQQHWYPGNVVLSTLANQMGIDITYKTNVANDPIMVDVNKNTALTNVEGSKVEQLWSHAIPWLEVGSGSNTSDNTTTVGSISSKPVITDTKVENGYITFLTDINMWMDDRSDTIGAWSYDSGNFMKNLLRRSVYNIEAVLNMNKITYTGLEGSHYASDGGKNTLTNPSAYTSSTDTFVLNNPIKEGYEFVGWTGTGLSGLTKSVTVAKGSTGDRSYTANWHKHEWVYSSNGSIFVAYCKANNLYSNLCSYNGIEHSVSLFVQAQGNSRLCANVQPSNATNKDLFWASSDTSVLTVDQNGVIYGVKAGTATVKAKSTDGSNKSATCTVTVIDEQTCFAGGTKIAMADGSYKDIEDVVVGDWVFAYDTAMNQKYVTPVITTSKKTTKDIVKVTLTNGTSVLCTPSHPLLSVGGYKSVDPSYLDVMKEYPSEKLCVGDLIVTEEGTFAVESIYMEQKKVPVYNFHVKSNGSDYNCTYFANGIVVHNGSGC